MRIITNIAAIPKLPKPIALAIGTFDGVHLGHRHLINQMKEVGSPVIFTFSNHPLAVLNSQRKVPSLTTPEQKLDLLRTCGVETVIIQPFTKDMANMTYNLFLEELYEMLPFDHLFFGEEDALGKDREGTPDKIQAIGKSLHFTAHYLPKLTIDHLTCSSSAIREALKDGDLKTAENLLGRPFSIYITSSSPWIDEGLLKPGNYNLIVKSPTQQSTLVGEVTKTGDIIFDFPKDPENQLHIIFTKG